MKTSFSCIYNEHELQLNLQKLCNKRAVYMFIYWCGRRRMCKNKTPKVRLGLLPCSVQSENSNLCGAIIQMEGVCTCGQGWTTQGSEIESVVSGALLLLVSYLWQWWILSWWESVIPSFLISFSFCTHARTHTLLLNMWKPNYNLHLTCLNG